MDNLHTPTTASLEEACAPTEAKRIADTFVIHAPPQHGRWFNMAEIERRHRRRPCLGDRRADKNTLLNKVYAWNTTRHASHAKAHGQFTTEDARVKLRRLYPIISS
jgi:hypothetical protein